MIRSMTGFGRAEATENGREISVEIKSVNHRYFDFSCRTSRGYAFLEEKLKSYVNSRVSRGKIDMYVSVTAAEDNSVKVSVNHSLAAGYADAFAQMADRYKLANDITATTLARLPDVLTVHKTPEDEQTVLDAVMPVAAEAVDRFIAMRTAEGNKLSADVLARTDSILHIVEFIEERSPALVAEHESRMHDRICELLGDRSVDEARLLTEVAIFADKVAVDEETVRLRSHFDQMRAIMTGDDAVGRKLDFIVQEMNREANTIGSKVQDAELAHQVVDIKAELEKIREQIQNIE